MALIRFIKVNVDTDEGREAAGNFIFGETDGRYPVFQIWKAGRMMFEYKGYDNMRIYEILKAWT